MRSTLLSARAGSNRSLGVTAASASSCCSRRRSGSLGTSKSKSALIVCRATLPGSMPSNPVGVLCGNIRGTARAMPATIPARNPWWTHASRRPPAGGRFTGRK